MGELYLPRPADVELPAALLRGEMCYVLAPRQMGKSSLRLRAQQDLEGRGVRCASVDLTKIGGKNDPATNWYFSLIDSIRKELNDSINKDLGLPDPQEFWRARQLGTPVQGFVDYIREKVAGRLDGPAVIFIDELDGLLSLEAVSRDEFLAAVRALHNARADAPELARVTFCLLGAALPGDLIEDERLTPFNVGRSIVLEDFHRTELAPLAAVLEPTLDAVYGWTTGHPFMTMKLCDALLQRQGMGPADVDDLVRDLFLKKRLREPSLAYAEKQFERKAKKGRVDQMLWLYGRVCSGQDVEARLQDPVQGALALTGMVAERFGQLEVRNRILGEVFDGAWVKKQQAE